jgi:uncharacterized protein (TIGR03437 family)
MNRAEEPTMTRRSHRLGAAGLVLLIGCVESELAPELEESEFSTPQHEDAALQAYVRTCAREVVGGQPLMNENDAVRWINDPDCLDNNCEKYDITTANPNQKRAHEEEGDASLLWACRNADHFSSNGIDGRRSTGPAIITDDNFTEFRNNKEARAQLIAYGIARATEARQTSDPARKRTLMRAALRAGFRAAHYTTDGLACGHDIGNNLCDYRASSVPLNSPCGRFVNDAGNRATTSWKTNWFALDGSIEVCRGGSKFNPNPLPRVPGLVDGGQLPMYGALGGLRWEPTIGMGYAAAERLIRHYSRGRDYTDFNPQTGATFTNSNNCSKTCEDGECIRLPEVNGVRREDMKVHPGSAREKILLGDSATADVAQICAAFKPKVTTTNSGSFRRISLNGRDVTGDNLLDDSALLPTDNFNAAADQLVTGFAATLPTDIVLPGSGDRKDPANPLCTTQLGGRWSVRVSWGAGRSENACLFFLGGPNRQVNFKMPSGIGEGQVVTIEVVDEAAQDVVAVDAPVLVGPVEPGLFTANALGFGLVSGQVFRRIDGQDLYTDLTQEPINLHLERENLTLILYGTGIRGRGPGSDVRVTVAGRPATVDFAGAQGSLLGFDQVNLIIPTAPLLQAQVEGAVGIELEIQTADGRAWKANRVEVILSSAPPA